MLVDAVNHWRWLLKILHGLLGQLQQALLVGHPVARQKLELKLTQQKQLQVSATQLLGSAQSAGAVLQMKLQAEVMKNLCQLWTAGQKLRQVPGPLLQQLQAAAGMLRQHLLLLEWPAGGKLAQKQAGWAVWRGFVGGRLWAWMGCGKAVGKWGG